MAMLPVYSEMVPVQKSDEFRAHQILFSQFSDTHIVYLIGSGLPGKPGIQFRKPVTGVDFFPINLFVLDLRDLTAFDMAWKAVIYDPYLNRLR